MIGLRRSAPLRGGVSDADAPEIQRCSLRFFGVHAAFTSKSGGI
jgi:hypothetical protein